MAGSNKNYTKLRSVTQALNKKYSQKTMKQICIIIPLILCLLTGCIKPMDIISDVTPPAEVEQLIVAKSDLDVKLTWTDPGDNDLRGIRITLYNANNQNEVLFADVLPDSASYTIENLSPGNYYVKVQTRDKENNLSAGVKVPFIFISKVPTNVQNISSTVYWNVLHLDWDSLTAGDFVTTVEGETITNVVDSIVVVIDDTVKYLMPVTATGKVIPDLADGSHQVKIYTRSTEGYYSGNYSETLSRITFGQKFVRVKGGGFDFYIARYEVTTEECRQFIVDSLGISWDSAKYTVNKAKVEDDAWFKWWYGNDPKQPGVMNLLGFNTDWDFNLTAKNGWYARRYASNDAFGKFSWEGAMLYCLVNYNGRCPTEDEWLYAASGGKLSKGYDYAGSNDPDAVGWWGWVDGTFYILDPVGQKLPNELGIYDMSGNAGEILYDIDNDGIEALGNTIIAGGSTGPNHYYCNEGEEFALGKPKLTDPEVIRHTGINTNDGRFRMGVRVLIPHKEIVKLPFDRHKYEQ
jgi:hypothetical protein